MKERTYTGLDQGTRKYLFYFDGEIMTDLGELAEAREWTFIGDPFWGDNSFLTEQTALVILRHATNNPQLSEWLHRFYAAQVLATLPQDWEIHREEVYRWIIATEPVVRAMRNERNGGCPGCG